MVLVVVDNGTPELPSVLERNGNVVNIYVLHLLKAKKQEECRYPSSVLSQNVQGMELRMDNISRV